MLYRDRMKEQLMEFCLFPGFWDPLAKFTRFYLVYLRELNVCAVIAVSTTENS